MRTSFKRTSTTTGANTVTSGAFALMYNRDNMQKAFGRIRSLGVKLNNIDAEGTQLFETWSSPLRTDFEFDSFLKIPQI